MTWGATASAILGAGMAYKQSQDAKDLAKDQEREAKKAASKASKSTAAKALESAQGDKASSYMGVYAPGSKTTLGG